MSKVQVWHDGTLIMSVHVSYRTVDQLHSQVCNDIRAGVNVRMIIRHDDGHGYTIHNLMNRPLVRPMKTIQVG